MHEFYFENQGKLKKNMDHYLKLIASELEQEAKTSYDKLLEETWTVYKERMLEYFPYIGGKQASGTNNLTGAYAFVALGEVICENYGVSLERWGELITLSYRRYFQKIPTFARKLAGKLFCKPSLVYKMLRKKDEKNRLNASKNPGSFETKVQEPTPEYPIIYHTTVCPLAGFAKQHGFMKYMPYICNLDYAMFESMQVPFYREKTIASGDDCCDFKLKLNAPVVPSWPCHGTDPNDPLK